MSRIEELQTYTNEELQKELQNRAQEVYEAGEQDREDEAARKAQATMHEQTKLQQAILAFLIAVVLVVGFCGISVQRDISTISQTFSTLHQELDWANYNNCIKKADAAISPDPNAKAECEVIRPAP